MLLTGAGAFPVSFAVLFFCYFLLFCFLLFCFGSRVVEVVVCRRGDFLVRFQFGVGVFSGSVFLLLDLVWTLTDLRCGGGGCRICDSLVTWFFQRRFLVLGWFFGVSTVLVVLDLDLCLSDGDVVLVL